jgi:uncharacterized protein (DUF885 family)
LKAALAVLLAIQAAAPPAGPAGSARARLAALGEEYWQFVLARDVGARRAEGLPVERLPDVTLADAEAEAAFGRSLRAALREIPRAELDAEDRLTHDILSFKADAAAAAPELYWFRFPVTPYSSPFRVVNPVFTAYRFQRPEDLDAYRRLLAAYGTLLDQVNAKLVAQRARGILLPKEEIDLVVPFLGSLAGPETNLFQVRTERLASIPADRAPPFQRDVDAAVAGRIRPALDAIVTLLRGEYRAQAPDAVGLGQYPGGSEAYRSLVRQHTTLDVTPEAVHRIGLEEVERLEGRMKAVRDALGWKGTAAEFQRHLQSEARFHPKTADEIGERLRAHARRIEPKMGEYFLERPRAPYDVRRLDPTLESTLTYGYYQVPTAADPRGCYNYNGSKLSERSLVNSAALAYHELVPGHHLQMALQGENALLPPFRRRTHDTAYIEGWGTYAADLAEEMGMYSDPYDLYGRFTMELFLAVRLVVDTGMNALGWPRSRAVAYMKERLQESDTQIHTETLRYSVDMPGQALAYRMGARKLVELREKARRTLGPRFDVRRFHQVILGSGSMPLSVLERRVDEFLAAERR